MLYIETEFFMTWSSALLKKFFFQIEVELVYSVSGVQQSGSVIHIYSFSDSFPL